MHSRPLSVVTLAALVLLSGVGAVGGVGTVGDAGTVGDDAGPDTAVEHADGPIDRSQDAAAQYKVSLNNVTIETWLLRNATVVNATIDEVVVRNATTTNGTRTNVTLPNVTVGRFDLERARLQNVTARKLVIRNRSVLDVPGGDFIDPNVENRTIERQWTRNQTVSGVAIDRITVDAAILCENATLGQRAAGDVSFDPTAGEDPPDITVENGTVEEALVMRGEATNWSVESVQQPDSTNASLPEGCNRA
ncbi:hypothetical protein [Halorussus salinisoli]|uniref:hypothetical protein n=1 Tax=Halorussus salinisoli TaxID=2558242 RepID=UPI0010C20BD3|nr:hypothetical protein [Halorussus salinisoli]